MKVLHTCLLPNKNKKGGNEMFVDPITVQFPEALEKERFVIATYYCATSRDTNSLKFAVALGIEQSCGTWLKVPGETQEVRERSIARVIHVRCQQM